MAGAGVAVKFAGTAPCGADSCVSGSTRTSPRGSTPDGASASVVGRHQRSARALSAIQRVTEEETRGAALRAGAVRELERRGLPARRLSCLVEERDHHP